MVWFGSLVGGIALGRNGVLVTILIHWDGGYRIGYGMIP